MPQGDVALLDADYEIIPGVEFREALFLGGLFRCPGAVLAFVFVFLICASIVCRLWRP